jgi:ribosomal protein S6--L-glutamate ligase
MHFLNIKECYATDAAENPEINIEAGIILNQSDAIIPRIRPSTFAVHQPVNLSVKGIPFELSSTTQSRDKLYSLNLCCIAAQVAPTQQVL